MSEKNGMTALEKTKKGLDIEITNNLEQDYKKNKFSNLLKLIDLQKLFKSLLHREPPKEEIKEHSQYKGYRYLPISFLEMKLDEMFYGLWSVENFRFHVIANEVVGAIDLKVYFSTANEWIIRTGAASVPIQMRSKSKGGSGDLTDVNQKYPNALVKNFPALKASCFRNACLSLGKSMGRDLNRELEDEYSPIIDFNIVEKSQENNITEKLDSVIVNLEYYNGSDKEQIREEVKKKDNAHELTLEYLQSILDKITGAK